LIWIFENLDLADPIDQAENLNFKTERTLEIKSTVLIRAGFFSLSKQNHPYINL